MAVTGIAIGGLAIAWIAGTASEGRGTLPVFAQAVYDRGLRFGLLAIAILYGVIGDQAAPLLFGGSGLAVLTVAITTCQRVRTI